MRRRLAILVLAAACLPAQKDRGKKDKDKPPDLELIDLKFRRDDKVITVEGRVRNISAKPMKGIVLFFELLESDKKMIVRLSTDVTREPVEPGEDASFDTQAKDIARAVSARVDAEDVDGRYFKIDKPGPYQIE